MMWRRVSWYHYQGTGSTTLLLLAFLWEATHFSLHGQFEAWGNEGYKTENTSAMITHIMTPLNLKCEYDKNIQKR